MTQLRTRSIESIENRMKDIDEGSFRHEVLENAKNFKTSWIELGQALYAVWKDKLYREWGFMTFEAYVSKEIGIRKETALKLLKSYYFLEKEDPRYLKSEYISSNKPASIPSYESVNVLRLARNKKTLDEDDYAKLKRDVLDAGKDASAVKKDLTSLIRQREELEPEEARKNKRIATVKRFLSTLKSLKRDIEISKLVSAGIVKEVSNLIQRIEAEIN